MRKETETPEGRSIALTHYMDSRNMLVVVKEYDRHDDEELEIELQVDSEKWRFEVDDMEGVAYPVATTNEAGGAVLYMRAAITKDPYVWEYVTEELGYEVQFLNPQ